MPEKVRRRHFLANSCQVCKKITSSYDCDICHMISYCSVDHRREDWLVHSHLCRVINKLCTSKGIDRLYQQAVGRSADEYRAIRHRTAMECGQMLGRALESWELELLYWPKICGVCYLQATDLESCHDCAFVFACPRIHRLGQHAAWCGYLTLYQDIVRFIDTNSLPSLPVIHIPDDAVSMKNILSSTDQSLLTNTFLSEVITYPMTVLQALWNHSTSSSLIVHVVGAELQAEVLPLYKWEHYLLHLLSECQQLTLVFVGPSLKVPEETLASDSLPLCQKCRDRNKTLRYEIVADTLYHNYQANGVNADVIVALNAGLYRNIGFNGADTWASTLKKMFDQNTASTSPVMISEYTEHEILQDLALVKDKFPNVTILKAPQPNPFASTRPNLNVVSDNTIPVIFKNFYYTMLSP